MWQKYLGKRKVIERKTPVFYAEDFAYYEQLVPGIYAYLGVRPKSEKHVPGLHNPRFTPESEALKTGMMAHVLFTLGVCG